MASKIKRSTPWVNKLDPQGRCCGRKPLVYKREPHLFCFRCNRAFDSTTGKQITNWAWREIAPSTFQQRDYL